LALLKYADTGLNSKRMPDFSLKQNRTLKPTLRVKLGARLKMAQILEDSEEDFAKKVRELETDPIFNELIIWGGVKRKRFFGVSPAFFRKVSLEEGVVSYVKPALSDSVDKDTAVLIEKIGRENFTRYFLVPEKIYTVSEIATETGLNRKNIEKVADFINDFSISASSPKTVSAASSRSGNIKVIAAINRGQEGLLIEDLNFDLCRGNYLIDDSKIQQFKDSLPPGHKRNLNNIIAQLQWINGRRNIIYSILKSLLEKQQRFIVTGRPEDRKSLTQLQLSRELGIPPSLFNRAIKKRALKLPDGTTVPLKTFFPGRREEIKTAIRKILKEGNNGKISDSQIKIILRDDYGLSLARRTVNFYRNQIKVGA
jgi:hypothetical protein